MLYGTLHRRTLHFPPEQTAVRAPAEVGSVRRSCLSHLSVQSERLCRLLVHPLLLERRAVGGGRDAGPPICELRGRVCTIGSAVGRRAAEKVGRELGPRPARVGVAPQLWVDLERIAAGWPAAADLVKLAPPVGHLCVPVPQQRQ